VLFISVSLLVRNTCQIETKLQYIRRKMTYFRTHKLGELTWTEARDAAAQNPVVLLPSGAIEQHGPHLPLHEDAITAEWVADYIAEHIDTPVLVAPTASYGHSPA